MLRENPLLDFLVKKSFLTETQIDTCLCQKEGKGSGLSIKERISLRDGRAVKDGAFLRTYTQSQKNLESTIFTVILATYLELFPKEMFPLLMQVTQLVSKASKRRFEQSEYVQITNALDDISKRILA